MLAQLLVASGTTSLSYELVSPVPATSRLGSKAHLVVSLLLVLIVSRRPLP